MIYIKIYKKLIQIYKYVHIIIYNNNLLYTIYTIYTIRIFYIYKKIRINLILLMKKSDNNCKFIWKWKVNAENF